MFDYRNASPNYTGQIASGTRHNHPANFGRRVDGCPRCAELAAGAQPIRQDWRNATRNRDAARIAEIRAHDCRASGCGVVCTFGEW